MPIPLSRIGLVTVLYKSDDVLEDFFKSVSIQTYKDYFIYIVDNSPSAVTDLLVLNLTKKYSITQFIHVKNDSNMGVAAGNNKGIQLALQDDCEHVLLLNNDIEFEQPDLFLQLVNEALDKNHFLFVPKILFYDTRKIWMAGGRLDTWKPMAVHIGEGKEDQEKYNYSQTFNYAPTCFMLIHKSVFDKIGLMDEKYFVYYDDADFLYRAGKNNYKVFYLPKLVVLHKVSTSTGGKESAFSIFYGNRNRIYFIRKHLNFFLSIVAYAYTFLTRTIKFVSFDKKQREMLLQGLVDGFKIPL